MQDPHDGLLLAVLEAEDRTRLEAAVDAFIDEQLPSNAAACLQMAAEAFDDKSEDLQGSQRLVARQFAAALRDRARRDRLH